MSKLLLLFLLGTVQFAVGARILAFFPFPAKSHHNIFQPVIQSLASRGHQITFFTSRTLMKPNSNITEILVRNILDDLTKGLNDDEDFEFPTNVLIQSIFFGEMGLFVGKEIFAMKEFETLMNSNDKYDIVLSESLFAQESQSALAHRFNALSIDLIPHGDTCWYNEINGVPSNPAYMVDARTLFSPNMNLYERFQNTYTVIVATIVHYIYLWRSESLINTYFKYPESATRPKLSTLVSDKALVLFNSHHSMGYAVPMAPHVKEVGGLNIQDPKPLPKDLQTFLDDAKDGAIYFSFGSNLNMTQLTKKGIAGSLIKVFGELKQRILWKWDSDNYPKAFPNVKFSRWFPQQDILAHKNVKLFITHGGLLSTTEAINNGVPLIGVPIFADQPKNMQLAVQLGYGILLEKKNMTETSIRWAVNEALSNPSYTREVKKRSELFKDRTMKPLDEAVFWIEYVLKHGRVLQPKSVHLSFFVMHQLDVLGVFLIACYLAKKLIEKICCLCCRRKKVTKKNKKD